MFRTEPSHNYRFEAGAGRGKKYPAKGKPRPIGIFIRMPDSIFRYRLLWSGDDGYAEIDAFLTEQGGPREGNRMRRVPTTVAELAAAWPDSPLLKAIGPLP